MSSRVESTDKIVFYYLGTGVAPLLFSLALVKVGIEKDQDAKRKVN